MMNIPLDYETMRLIWWLLLGVLLIGFAIMDGFDLGVAALLPFAARTDEERRMLVNLIGPTWEGNQVWLILGGGAIFAAWPALYAVSFSGFYLAMIAILLALILRPVGFKFRSKVENTKWRSTWDWALFIGGFVPALIFGVAVGNVLLGVPFRFDDVMRIYYDGNFFGLLTPFALLCGLVSLFMLAAHGATVIVARVPGVVGERARSFGKISALISVVLFGLAGIWLAYGIDGYVVTSVQDTAGPSNPVLKSVTTASGAWLENYSKHSWMIVAPVLGLAGMALSFVAMHCRKGTLAFLCSSLGIFGIISTAGVSLFPFLLPSSIMPDASLTVWDASSSHLTLFIMLIATVIFMPLILAYTGWVYSVMRGPITKESVGKTPNAY